MSAEVGSRVSKVCLIGIALASVVIPASAAEHKAPHAHVWGAIFRDQVARCWHKPVGGDAAEQVEAVFKISLTRDGVLAEQPVAESPADSDFAKAYQKSAIRAINACQPYKLPVEYYEEWKLFIPVFSDRQGKSR